MSGSKPDVDVVIPCYNYAKYLRSCVESAVGQQGVEVRLLVIDDASTDDTPRVCRELALTHPRVEVRRHSANRGHIATYNEGLLEWAAAPYSLLLSADDMLAPGALQRATQLMNRTPEVGMCYGQAAVIRDQGGSLASSPDTAESSSISSASFLRYCFENAANPVPTPTAVVRTTLQQRLGGYDRTLPHSGDLEMWMRFAANAPIGVVRCVQAYYRWHGANMSTSYHERTLSDLRQVASAFERIVEDWGRQFPESSAWLDSARRAIGKSALWSARNAFELCKADECHALLAFAEEVYPKIRRSGIWWRLRAKRLLGRRAWRALRPVLARLVDMSPPSSGAKLDPSGTVQGWWPGVK